MVDITTIETEITSTIAKAVNIPTVDLQDTPTVPPLLVTLATDYSQKLVTIIFTLAVGHGALQFVDQLSTPNNKVDAASVESAVTQIAVGTALFVVSCAWTLGVANLRKHKMIALKNAVPSTK